MIDMSTHELEDEIEQIENLPWTSIPITQRVLRFEDFSFSLRSHFYW